MADSQECMKDQLSHLTSEQILDEYGDKFTANSLWCGRVACSFLKAYMPYGVVASRGTCVLRGEEHTDSAIALPELDADEPQGDISPLAVPSTPHRSIHTQAREAAAQSVSFSEGNLHEDALGHLSVTAISGLRWLGYR